MSKLLGAIALCLSLAGCASVEHWCVDEHPVACATGAALAVGGASYALTHKGAASVSTPPQASAKPPAISCAPACDQ